MKTVSGYKYEDYGKVIDTKGTSTNPFRYSGEYTDDETGFQYLRARYYNPNIRRFITEDTYTGEITNPLILNLYAYCSGNPIMYYDPSGNKAKEVFVAGAFTFVGGIGSLCAPEPTGITKAGGVALVINGTNSMISNSYDFLANRTGTGNGKVNPLKKSAEWTGCSSTQFFHVSQEKGGKYGRLAYDTVDFDLSVYGIYGAYKSFPSLKLFSNNHIRTNCAERVFNLDSALAWRIPATSDITSFVNDAKDIHSEYSKNNSSLNYSFDTYTPHTYNLHYSLQNY